MTVLHNSRFQVVATDAYGETAQQALSIITRNWLVDHIDPLNTLAYNSEFVEVTITGWGLNTEGIDTYVMFGEWPAEVFGVSDTEINVKAPIGPVCDVTIYLNGEPVGIFSYLPPQPPPVEPPGPLGIPMHQGRCLCLARMSTDRLELSEILDLMDDERNGITVDTVDLGFPDVRESMGVWADADGAWDYTRFFGARGISLSGALLSSDKGSRSKAFHSLIPYLDPSARPVLIYCFNADDDPRYLRIRGAGYSGAINNPLYTTWQGQWKAPEAIAYSLESETATVTAQEHSDFGRIYSEPQPDPGPEGPITPTSTWEPDRHYPEQFGAVSVNAENDGTVASWPIFEIHGECTAPAIFNDTTDRCFAMKVDFVVHEGEVLTINTHQRAVYLGRSPNSTRYGQVDFERSTWWPLVPGPNSIRFDPITANADAHLVVTWQHAFL
jgi:hypothetical protein